MSRFRKVASGTWGDERFRSLSESGKHLWLYLLTGNEVTSLPGVIVVGRAGLAEALGWSLSKLDRCFAELTAATNEAGVPMAKADWRARVVWLPNGHKHNVPANPNVIASWKDLWRAVPECGLKHEALIVLREFVATLGEKMAEAFATYVDRYDSVRRRMTPQQPDTTTIARETVSAHSLDSVPSSVPEQSLARARAATAPSTAPAADTSRVGPTPKPERVVDVGTARCEAACEAFVAALGEAGRTRGPLRQPWERQALCDAINAHLRADGTADGVFAEMRRAVLDWTVAKADDARFTSGWSPRKFADWLAEERDGSAGNPPGDQRPIGAPAAPTPAAPDRAYTPAELAAIDAQVAASVERLQHGHAAPSVRGRRAVIGEPGATEQSPAEREAERQRQKAALAAITSGVAPARTP